MLAKKYFLQVLSEGKLLLSKELLGRWRRTIIAVTVTLESFPTIYF